MILAYKAEYEHNPTITIDELLTKYSITLEDIAGYETWIKPGQENIVITTPTKKPKRVKAIDKVLANLDKPIEVLPPIVPTIPVEPESMATEVQLQKIENFKNLALDHCLKFMQKDAQFSEVKEFKDIVAIVDSLEKSYQKVDPDAGKPTINILVQNLMERFQDDC